MMSCVCEMCLKRTATERHHIIPKVAGIPGFEIDREDNMIDLCSICHSRLTPTSALTSYALHKKQEKNQVFKFAEAFMQKVDDEALGLMYSSEVIEIFKNVFTAWFVEEEVE